MRLALLVFVTGLGAGCGRYGFADRAAATTTDATLTPDVAAFAPDVMAIDAPTGPVAYAYFSMDADPSTGISASDPAYTGTCTTCPTATAGHHGSAIQFDATRTVTMSFQVGAQPYTIATWFSTSGQGTLLAKPFALVGVANVVNIAVNDAHELVYETFDGNNPAYLESFGAQIIGGWHHVAITWDGTTKVLYIDGASANTSTATVIDANQALVLGTDIDNGAADVAYTGALDELRFYAIALDATQVAALASQ